jgi:GNAT superfamily N-acetyltransferase
MTVRVRPGRLADLPACQAIWEASADLAPGDRPAPNPLYAHELHSGRFLVAEDALTDDGPSIVGFGASLERDGRWFLADLFVNPAGQSAGVGRLILDELVRDAPPERSTSASDDVRAQALYARAGMAPRWPLYELRGALPLVPGRLPVPWLRTEPAPPDDTDQGADAGVDGALARLDRELTGIDRAVDLRWLCHDDGAQLLWLVDELGARQGYALVQPTTPMALDPAARVAATVVALAVRRAELAVDAVLATIGAVAQWGGPTVRLHVPGPHPALPLLLEGGFRICDRDIYCASSDGLFDPTRRLPSSTVF